MVEQRELEVGREYALATSHGFKTGPHKVKYLGNADFDGFEREFFRVNRKVFEGRKEYFALRGLKFTGKFFDNVNQEDDTRNSLPIVNVIDAELDRIEEYLKTNSFEDFEPPYDTYELDFKIGGDGKFLGDTPSGKSSILDQDQSNLLDILRKFGEDFS